MLINRNKQMDKYKKLKSTLYIVCKVMMLIVGWEIGKAIIFLIHSF